MSTKKREIFNRYEREIMKLLYNMQIELTTRDIAEQTGMHWVTTKNYLEKLVQKKVVKKRKDNKRIFWKFNYKILQ